VRRGKCMPAAAETRSGRRRVMEGAMVLSFWMVLFMLLPTMGLGSFVWLMNRQQGHHR
jgi:hypothetical protein